MTDTIALHSDERAADDGIPVADLTDAGPIHTPIQQSMDLARIHGPVFKRRFGDRETLFLASLDLVTELADESRFAKACRPVAGERPRVRRRRSVHRVQRRAELGQGA